LVIKIQINWNKFETQLEVLMLFTRGASGNN